MSTISRLLLVGVGLLILTDVSWAQTPTPTKAVARRFNDCTEMPVGDAILIGTKAQRSSITYWNAGVGSVYCSQTTGTPTPNATPGNGWLAIEPGQGLSICEFADQPLWCFGDGLVCHSEARISNQ